jgi:hypothetical protein
VVAFPGGDGGFPGASVMRHAKKGSGYRMETVANAKGVALPVWDTLEAVEIQSSCAWHVRAIEGTPAQVKSQIPAVPPVFRMNTGDMTYQELPTGNSGTGSGGSA